ncbi:hypothetical protein niasHT_011910 [Heterodera trifolii]|uniref:Protein Abitram n=1 Tax=Heterodera trifolii TaxID=157864 RepID=A0ABD2KW67_9BILA
MSVSPPIAFPSPSHCHFSSIERNFSSFSVNSQPGLRYLRHASGVVVLTLDKSHVLMRDQCKNIAQVLWDLSLAKTSSAKSNENKGRKRGVDRSKLEPSGKGKKGGLPMSPQTRICIIRDSDGVDYVIRAGIRATLLEVNDEWLTKEPNLLRTAADNQGFIAILMPPISGNGVRNMKIPKEFDGTEGGEGRDRETVGDGENDTEQHGL